MKDPYQKEYYQTVSNETPVKEFTTSKIKNIFQDKSPVHISTIFTNMGEINMKLICGEDDRELFNGKEFPQNLICRLLINDKKGKQYVATGFFISPKCIITSGHCVFFEDDWVESITVIPGDNGATNRRPFGSQKATNFKSVEGWTILNERNFDYGAIILPDEYLFNQVKGYLTPKIISENQKLFNFGYSNEEDKEYEQWGSFGNLKEITSHRIFYNIDTVKGNSGSPIMIKTNNTFYVVGIHSYGKCPNYCIRINNNILNVWNDWKNL